MELPKIILKSGKDISLHRKHPWIFSGAIKKMHGNPNEGDLVELYDNHDNFMAVGHYQIGSIAVRVLSFQQEKIDIDFWVNRIEKAYRLRNDLGLLKEGYNTIFRLVHAEGDNLPGLIIDYYAGTAVVQMHSVGMFVAKDEIVEALKIVLGEKLRAIYEKSSATLPFKADIEPVDGFVFGGPVETDLFEYGNKFLVDWEGGQKTGFFIDQRENRKLVEFYSKDRKVLNVFGFTGGFSVYAMQGGAQLVHSVDSSKPAIDLTNQNIALNFEDTSRHEAFAVDAFKFLDDIDGKYDLIILDPPAFAKHHNVLHNALQGYKKLNARAIEQVAPGGIIFTFSCSQVVTKENFRKSVFAAAANSGRSVRILHQLTQPADHPVNIFHPESEYLKGLVLYVE